MYQPTPGSLAERVCQFFLQNPDEELTRSDIARKFDVVSPRNVEGSLATPVAHQVIVKGLDNSGQTLFKAGPNLQAALPPVAAPDAAKQKPKAKRKPASRERLPLVDAAVVAVAYDKPMPPMHVSKKGANKYDELLKKLDRVGASVELPIKYRAAVAKAAVKFARDNAGTPAAAKFSVRTVSPITCGVWRVA
jgi:hypothetical protein